MSVVTRFITKKSLINGRGWKTYHRSANIPELGDQTRISLYMDNSLSHEFLVDLLIIRSENIRGPFVIVGGVTGAGEIVNCRTDYVVIEDASYTLGDIHGIFQLSGIFLEIADYASAVTYLNRHGIPTGRLAD